MVSGECSQQELSFLSKSKPGHLLSLLRHARAQSATVGPVEVLTDP